VVTKLLGFFIGGFRKRGRAHWWVSKLLGLLIDGFLDFWGPKMALANAISQGPKNSRFPGPNPLPLALVMYLSARIKNITHEAV
jgi:hypothetical protein